MPHILSIAAKYINAGLKCIPIIQATKKPYNKKWSTKFLTLDEFQKLYKPGDGIAIITGKVSGIVSIDIDKKNGGLNWYEANKDRLGFPLIEYSGGGGIHLHYNYPANCEYLASDNHFADGVEIKADGGRYVVTAPSPHPSGIPYKIHHDIPLDEIAFEVAELPSWILDELNKKRHKTLEDPTYVNGLDGDIEQASASIRRFDGAIEGKGGDTKTFAAACECRRFGLTQIQTFEVLKTHFNPRCVPPWKDEDLKRKIYNAYKYANEPMGTELPEMQFSDESENVKEEKKSEEINERFKGLKVGDWVEEPELPVDHIITDLFEKGDKVAVIGRSKSKKSFFIQQMGFCIASGRPFLGHQVLIPRKVLIVQYEVKKAHYHKRCVKLAKRLDFSKEDLNNLIVVNGRGHPKPLVLLKEAISLYKPDLVIVDPLYKLIEGDENKIEEMKPIFKAFDTLCEETGTCLLYLHHDKKGLTGKEDVTDRGAGSGITARDYDTGIVLSKHDSESDSLVLEFEFRNNPPKENMTIEYLNGSFVVSDSLPLKRTQNSRVSAIKLPQLMKLAKKLLKEEYSQGRYSLDMAAFNCKLQDSGISSRKLTAIKEELEALNLISFQTRKAEKGRSSITVFISDTIMGEEGLKF